MGALARRGHEGRRMTLLADIGSLWLVGCGNMGGALLARWIDAGLPRGVVTVIDPLAAAVDGVRTVDAFPDDPLPAILVAAVKPQVAGAALEPLAARAQPSTLLANTLLVSIMAGIDSTALARLTGFARIVRAMPNTPVRVGAGVTGLFAPGPREPLAQALFDAAGTALWLDSEAEFDALAALSGCGPAYVFQLIEAMAAAGVAAGLSPDTAMQLARATVIGAARLAEADPAPADELRRRVTSPGGMTAAALDVIEGEERMLSTLMTRAVAAATARSRALGEGLLQVEDHRPV